MNFNKKNGQRSWRCSFTLQKKHGTGEGVSANETREATDKIQTLQKNNKEAVDESLGDMEGTVSTSVNHVLK
jgi:hypothetical protein